MGFGLPFTEDWALVQITNSAFIPASNVLYLGDKPANFKARMHPDPAAATSFNWPKDRLLPLRGTIAPEELKSPSGLDEQGEPVLMVLKRGRASGLTVGGSNAVESRRRVVAPGVVKYSLEWCILGENRQRTSSEKGDSGGIVVDGKGHIGGLLTSGSGEYVDVSYATPLEWFIERIETYIGHKMHVV